MQNVKYQIFISSTYKDLREHRDQVIKACLEIGHIPVGMEMFSAGNDEQWELIKRCIDEIDYYIVIIAHRYGSTIDDISFTEREYDYAVSRGVPVLGFIIRDAVSWLPEYCDRDGAKDKLDAFKEKVKRRLVSLWSFAEDLNGKCLAALVKAFNDYPRSGWVRASLVSGPEVAAELSRLSSENNSLRDRIDQLQTIRDTSHFSQEDDEVELTVEYQDMYDGETQGEFQIHTTWSELFVSVAKDLLMTSQHPGNFNSIIHDKLPSHVLAIRELDAGLSSESWLKIKTQFIALNLITFAPQQWRLTAHGQAYYVGLLRYGANNYSDAPRCG